MGQDKRSAEILEENFKKAITELLVLRVFQERPCYIKELTDTIYERSGGELSIVFPYAVFYRIYDAGFLVEDKKRTAPDGRLRQYYRLTETGQAYLQSLLAAYEKLSGAADNVIHFVEEES